MGVINREVNAGIMKLLYSSPIRVRDIVMGNTSPCWCSMAGARYSGHPLVAQDIAPSYMPS